MKSKIALLLAIVLPAAVSAAPTYSMHVPTKGLIISATAATPSSSSSTTSAANNFQELSYGGLTLVKPSATTMTVADTFTKCATVINGTTGWRLPTGEEWQKLQSGLSAAQFTAAGYDMRPGDDWVWTSEIRSGGNYWVGHPTTSALSYAGGSALWYPVCVKG